MGTVPYRTATVRFLDSGQVRELPYVEADALQRLRQCVILDGGAPAPSSAPVIPNRAIEATATRGGSRKPRR